MGDDRNDRCELHDHQGSDEGRSSDQELIFHPERTEPDWLPFGAFGKTLRCAYGEVSGELYSVIAEEAFKQWSQTKTGDYGVGVGNTLDDKAKIERVGKLGEIVFAKFTGLPVDFTYREGGDRGYDFEVNNITFDMKTALRNYGAGLVKAISENGIKLELRADNYIFGFRVEENREDGFIKVAIVGWQTKEWILEKAKIHDAKARKKDGSPCDWQNYEVPYHKVLPIRDLIEQIKSVV